MLERHGLLQRAATASERPPSRPPARRAWGDRQEHDRRRVRRHASSSSTRPRFPTPNDGHRPRASGLLLPRERGRTSRARHHPRPRGPPRALPWMLRDLGRRSRDYGGQLMIAMARRSSTSTSSATPKPRCFRPGKVAGGPVRDRARPRDPLDPRRARRVVRCDLGTILLTGDYKFDQTPVDGEPADVRGWPSWGARASCCCAATPRTRTARDVADGVDRGPNLRASSGAAPGRIVMTRFASNIHRVQQVVDAAVDTGRKVSLVGRSMRKNANIARRSATSTCQRGT